MSDPRKHYPAQYRCGHCGHSGFTAKEGLSTGGGARKCPYCRFGTLVKMHWNGFRWN